MQANNLVKINGNSIEQIVYKNQPVITLRMMDELHKRPLDTARKAFNRHKDHLIENEDYFVIPYEQWSNFLVVQNMDDQKGGHKSSMTFLTQTGYLLLVKSFTDQKAWEIQRELVNVYFQTRQSKTTPIDEKLDQLAKLKRIKSALSKQEYEVIKADVLQNMGYIEITKQNYQSVMVQLLDLLVIALEKGESFEGVYMSGNEILFITRYLHEALQILAIRNKIVFNCPNAKGLSNRLIYAEKSFNLSSYQIEWKIKKTKGLFIHKLSGLTLTNQTKGLQS